MFESASQAPWWDGLFPYAFLFGYVVFLCVIAVLGLMVLWRVFQLLGLHIQLSKQRLAAGVTIEASVPDRIEV